MIKVGDLVKVKNWGHSFTTFTQWFIDHAQTLRLEWIIKYAYNNHDRFENHCKTDQTIYKVLYKDDRTLLICNDCECGFDLGSVYLIDIGGVEKYIEPKQMTQKEIEDILGYPIKLVEEHTDEV